MSDEPITFVVERHHGGESACIIYGPLPSWLTAKGSNRMIYAWRLDRVPEGAALAQKPIAELYAQYVVQRDAGRLPPSNLADPPRQAAGGQKGMERGPETWWEPTPLPRGQDWTP